TLEPCCHTNKKTPPCLPALLEAKLARVVVGCPDPNPQVAGRGIQQLRDAGLEVDLSSLESECQQLIAPYIAGTLHHRPYVTLKWARSADGKVAGAGGRRFQISNARSMRIVHELRGRCDAIMVGCHTVQWDDPLLTARDVANPRSLLRVVVDSELQTPIESQLVQTAKKWPVIIYCVWKGWDEGQTHQELGVEIVTVGAGRNRRVDLREVLTDLAARGVTHLLVEPGPALARSFLNENLADRVWVFDSPKAIGEPDSPHAPDVPYPVTASHDVDGDILTEYLNPQSAAFFANLPSPDFHLAMSPL
ncbi:MAG TPA: bifunctional diaminohydroxyphosphoribosylaminopyrimidine deaminase/5-amino-6-(5-phosphoribosylamino)uracil reductase RibD, partial [Tepidisphaeraceae bacterium]